ncbi:hypothetical protein P3L10_019134 [Capsicum annuum]
MSSEIKWISKIIDLERRRRNDGHIVQVSVMRFRSNLLASGGEPYAEDRWSKYWRQLFYDF